MNPELTKDWALWQESIFAGATPDPLDVMKWNLVAAGQEATCVSNLTFRQRIIDGDLEIARLQFDALRRNGYWVEGLSYLHYCLPALTWAINQNHNITTADEMLFNAAQMERNYERLAFPDGVLPLPEVSSSGRFPFDPLTAEDDYCDDSYRVHRWFNPDHTECIAQLLVSLDTNPEPRANFHHHYDAGYFVLWVKGIGYVNRVAAYTGFDAIRNAESADVAAVLPEGALLPTWRVTVPEVTCRHVEVGFGFYFQWYYDDMFGAEIADRRITWDSQRVSVTDNGVTRTWEVPTEL